MPGPVLRWLGACLALCLTVLAGRAEAGEPPRPARVVKVVTLSTMLADAGLGEWGYAALVQVDGRQVLFDTGARPEVVLQNAKELGIDLSAVEDVVISHFHSDHTGGLLPLRRALMARNPKALSRLHVGAGIFETRFDSTQRANNSFVAVADAYRQTGGIVKEHAGPVEIVPGAWLTGPVPRPNDERNWSPGFAVKVNGELVPDDLREDSSLVIPTAQGAIVITGCGHAGIMNIADAAHALTGDARCWPSSAACTFSPNPMRCCNAPRPT